jgi:hypothetical protein
MFDLFDQLPMFSRHDPSHVGKMVCEHRRPMEDHLDRDTTQ